MLWVLIATATLAAQPLATTQTVEPCVRRPMPPAIDSAGTLPTASDVIEFAATPWQHPGRAWVVRLSRRGEVEATLEILRLRRQRNCNRYDVESRWRMPLRQEEYSAIVARVVSVGVPASTVIVPSSTDQFTEVVLDGTSIDLRLRSREWQVTRSLNHYGQGGADVSAIFRDLVLKYVPASELPTEDWRTPSREAD